MRNITYISKHIDIDLNLFATIQTKWYVPLPLTEPLPQIKTILKHYWYSKAFKKEFLLEY